MKKRIMKSIGIVAGAALTLSLFAACGPIAQQKNLNYDDGVVKAFNAVTFSGELVSQTAVEEQNGYLVTVVTPDSVSEYTVGSDFQVGKANNIVGDGPVLVSLAAVEGESAVSDLERAFKEALYLSGIAPSEVLGFDFDKGTYMGTEVFKVEIEDAVAEYSYTFAAADLSLIESKIELKNAQPAGTESSYIGEQKAKAIALDAAGIGENDAKNFTLKSILDGGRKLYKAAFDYDGFRYAVDIDALTGDIVKYAKSAIPSTDGAVSNPEIAGNITEERAKEIAVAFAFPDGADGHTVQFRKVKLDYERGKFIYEVEFIADYNEYEIEIDAQSGAILDVEIEAADDDDRLPQGGQFITREQALAKVREKVGSDIFVIEIDIDKEFVNGERQYFYEIEVKVGNREIEYRVNAVTGEIVENEDYAGNLVSPNLTEDEAMKIALEYFKLDENNIDRKKVKLEREDGRLCYEIELYVGRVEYSIKIDAQNGKAFKPEIDNDHEIDDDHADVFPQQPATGDYITREQAIQAVKEYAAGKYAGANIVIEDVELEDEGVGANKRYYYEVEVKVNGREYDFYVDAITGDVSLKGELIGGGQELIGEERALAIALDKVSLTQAEVRVEKVKLDDDDGILIYEVEFKVRDMEYSFEIDAVTGTILDWEKSFD